MKITRYTNGSFMQEIKKIEDEKMWFMNWDEDIDLEPILKKKEWSSAY